MDRKQRFFIYLTALFVAALVTGDFIGGKFFTFMGRTFSTGIIPFPLTFVLTDIVNEFYGKEGARRMTYAGLVAALFVWAVISLALALPTAPLSPIPESVFNGAFGISSRLYLASLTAYTIGQLLDIAVFQWFRRATGNKLVWLRATGSTVLSQSIDSLVVSFVFLAGTRPLSFIVSNAFHNYFGKLTMAILLTPLVYAGHMLFRRIVPATNSPATV